MKIARFFTIQKPRTIELDFLRGLAIIVVMLNHFEQAPASHPILRAIEQPFKLFGQTGVDLFFVLSGFLVGGLLLREYLQSQSINFFRFILRRGLKIWPAYYFYILFQWAAGKHAPSTFLVQNLLHLQNYLGSSLSHTWTLALEEHFYLILAVAMALMARWNWPIGRILKVFLGTMLLVFALRSLTVYEGWPGAAHYTHDRLDSLLAGVVLATAFHFYPQTFDRLAANKWVLAGLAAGAVLFRCFVSDVTVEDTIGFNILYCGYGALLLLVYRHSGAVKRWLPYRWIAWIGLYSYGIYLWHNAARETVLHMSIGFPEPIKWPLITCIQLIMAVGLGVLSTLLVEWPALHLRDRLFPSRVALSFQIETTALTQVENSPEAEEENHPAPALAIKDQFVGRQES